MTDNANAAGRRHARVAIACAGLVAVMVGAAYAAVPLYDLFCRVTGFDGTPSIAVAPAQEMVPLERTVTIRFDANVSPELPWRFTPEQRTMTVHVGEVAEANYIIENVSSKDTVGMAAYNVTPYQAGGHFTKIQCFCFGAQPLKANERLSVPVVFYVDPAFDADPNADGVDVITLSYTFYPFAGESPPAEG